MAIFRVIQDEPFLSLPYLDEMAVRELVRRFNCDQLPLLQMKTKGNSDVLFGCLTFLETQQIEKVLHYEKF